MAEFEKYLAIRPLLGQIDIPDELEGERDELVALAEQRQLTKARVDQTLDQIEQRGYPEQTVEAFIQSLQMLLALRARGRQDAIKDLPEKLEDDGEAAA